MKKEQKGVIVQRMTSNLGRASIALISEHKGLTAGQADDMRRRLREANSELQVAKNTLVRRALKSTRYEALEANLGGSIGLIVSYADPVDLAKTVGGFK